MSTTTDVPKESSPVSTIDVVCNGETTSFLRAHSAAQLPDNVVRLLNSFQFRAGCTNYDITSLNPFSAEFDKSIHWTKAPFQGYDTTSGSLFHSEQSDVSIFKTPADISYLARTYLDEMEASYGLTAFLAPAIREKLQSSPVNKNQMWRIFGKNEQRPERHWILHPRSLAKADTPAWNISKVLKTIKIASNVPQVSVTQACLDARSRERLIRLTGGRNRNEYTSTSSISAYNLTKLINVYQSEADGGTCFSFITLFTGDINTTNKAHLDRFSNSNQRAHIFHIWVFTSGSPGSRIVENPLRTFTLPTGNNELSTIPRELLNGFLTDIEQLHRYSIGYNFKTNSLKIDATEGSVRVYSKIPVDDGIPAIEKISSNQFAPLHQINSWACYPEMVDLVNIVSLLMFGIRKINLEGGVYRFIIDETNPVSQNLTLRVFAEYLKYLAEYTGARGGNISSTLSAYRKWAASNLITSIEIQSLQEALQSQQNRKNALRLGDLSKLSMAEVQRRVAQPEFVQHLIG